VIEGVTPLERHALAATLGVLLLVGTAHADPSDPAPAALDTARTPIVWDPMWARAGWVDYAVTGASAGAALAAAIVPPQPKHAYGGVLFDEQVRDALRLPSLSARYAARDASDVLLSLSATWPFFVDGMITAWWYRQSPDVAYEMMVIDAEAFAITAALQGVTNTIASRERPYGRDCGRGLSEDAVDCDDPVRYRSFFSGHSALTFTSAGLLCSHHIQLDLLGGSADAVTCVTGYVVAATTASLRVLSDVHYATDVLTGAVIGTTVGLVVPALHYRRRDRVPRAGGLDLRILPSPTGASVVGTF
jgi:membrane-associated phospholipid phosphatase